MSEKKFSIELISYNKSLSMLVGSLMRISNLSSENYVMCEDGTSQANIVIVDGDDNNSMKEIMLRRQKNQSLPVIITSMKELKKNYKNVYHIPKKKLGSLLIKVLDEIAIKHFHKAPSVLIGKDEVTKECTKNHNTGVFTNGECKNGCVLVIDDSLAVRRQLSIFLEMYSLQIDLASSAEEGIKFAREKKYSLIFLDIILPEMNGYKACKLLKQEPMSEDTPVVMLTGKSSTFNKLRGVMAGCDQYITKPVNGKLLQKVLLQYIPILQNKYNTNLR